MKPRRSPFRSDRRPAPRSPRPAPPFPERGLFAAWLERGPTPPPLDRFLSLRVRPQIQSDPAERKALSGWMFAAVRHAVPALFSQWLLLDAQRRDKFLTHPAPDMLAAFAGEIGDPADLFSCLRSVDPEVFFAWVAQYSGLAKPPAYVARYGAEIRAALGKMTHPDAALLLAGVPLWFGRAWTRRVETGGLDAGRFLAALPVPPPMWIRPRGRSPEEIESLRAELAVDGIAMTAQEGGFAVSGTRSLFETTAHAAGRFEIQDLGSQTAGALVACRPGEMVWDACAGAGGKTLQIAGELRGRGAVYSSDVRPDKLDLLRKRARRAGVADNVRVTPFEGRETPELPLEVAKRGGFDWVLVDAPCSSSGTWRRNPDARLRNTPTELPATVALQRRLLSVASGAVRPGGKLVYVTCSWLVEEDEDVANAFDAAHPDFESVSRGLHGGPVLDSDTLFGAVWKRKV